MAISKIQTGDKVKVISGNYKGTVGLVTKVVRVVKGKKISKRLSVNTIPKIVKYRKKFSYQGESYPGAQLSVDRFIDLSNVMLLDSSDKVSKSKIVITEGKKFRHYKTTNTAVAKEDLPKEITADSESKNN
jgi:large subunit ribosomal protein L24